MNGFERVVIGSIAGSLIGAAMFFTLEGLMPGFANSMGHDKCEMQTIRQN